MNNMGEELLNTDIYLGGELVGVPANAISFSTNSFSTNDSIEEQPTENESVWVQPTNMEFSLDLPPDSVNSLWDFISAKISNWNVNQRRLPRKKKKLLKKQLNKMSNNDIRLSFLKRKS